VKKYEDFVDSISYEEKVQILTDYKQFQKDGFIGDCLLRTKAREYCKFLDIQNNEAFLEILSKEIGLEFAFKYIQLKEKNV